MKERMMKTLKIIHAGPDAQHYEVMKRHMVMMLRNGLIKFVDDIGEAQIVCVLLSANFVADEHAWAASEDAKRRWRAGECRLVPIYVEYLNEVPDHLLNLVYLPRSGEPARTDKHWAQIAGEIRAIAMQ